MKKALILGLAVVTLAVFATSASAITCTIDTRPAATLLVPYFHVQADNVSNGLATSFSKDTLVTIGNASSRGTIAHVTVWNHKSVFVLDFNIALTPFDIQALSMGDILVNGNLPSTPDDNGDGSAGSDVCQRNGGGNSEYVRFNPGASFSGPNDPTVATTIYSTLPSSLLASIQDELDYDANDDCGNDDADGSITGPNDGTTNGNLYGYITIDMVNFCTLVTPDDTLSYEDDIIGWENNLWGDYIIKSDDGIPTYGAPMIAIEADPSLTDWDTSEGFPVRTFYARYWNDTNNDQVGDTGQIHTTAEQDYLDEVGLFFSANRSAGDMREPLGLRYAARFLDESDGSTSSYFRVWRAGSGSLTDLCNPNGSTESVASVDFRDEHENEENRQGGGCPSPIQPSCTPGDNFPWETQRRDVQTYSTLSQDSDGWAYLDFTGGSSLDQAWVGYDFESGVANLNAGIDGTQLDPSTCNPVISGTYTDNFPTVPFLVGLGE